MDDRELIKMLQHADESEAAARSPWRATLVSLAVFAGMALLIQPFAVQTLLIVTAAILFHELGHFLCMRWFGFRNVQIFFIPFLGGLATGTKHAVPDWQNAVVLLAGPIPGLIIASLVLPSFPKEITVVTPEVLPLHTSILFEIAYLLLALNGFNLLPFIPLDGGRHVVEIAKELHSLLTTKPLSLAGSIAVMVVYVASWALPILAVLDPVKIHFVTNHAPPP